MMAEPRGKIEYHGFTVPGIAQFADVKEVKIAAWCRDEKAQLPPEQVHFMFTIKGLEEYPMVVRFKSPETIGFLIEELARYRHEVWPDAEPVRLEE